MTPDLEIVYRDPAALKAYGRNARKHSAEQIAAIRRSIDEFGFRNPILLKDDDATIGAGHGRQAAALMDPPLERVPTITLHGLSELQWRAYVIADNRLAEAGSAWDFEALKLEFADLSLGGFDVALTGFSDDASLAQILTAGAAPTDPAAEWRGMPEFEHADKTAFRSLVVHFKDQEAVDAFLKATGRTLTPSTRYLWFPPAEIETYVDKGYVSEP